MSNLYLSLCIRISLSVYPQAALSPVDVGVIVSHLARLSLRMNVIAHQIRVHLQYLGYPIANDPMYSDTRIWVRPLGFAPLCLQSAQALTHRAPLWAKAASI